MRSDRFKAAAEAKDFSAVDELFAEDVTFRSPVVYAPYEGREAIAMLLGAVTFAAVLVAEPWAALAAAGLPSRTGIRSYPRSTRVVRRCGGPATDKSG